MNSKKLYVIFNSDTGDLVPPFALNTDGAARQCFSKFVGDARKNGSLDDFGLFGVGDINWDIDEVCDMMPDGSKTLRYELRDVDVIFEYRVVQTSATLDDSDDSKKEDK